MTRCLAIVTVTFLLALLNEDVFLLSQKSVNNEAHNSFGPMQNIPAGVFLLFLELVLSVIIASTVKLLSDDLNVFSILFFRYILSIPLLLLYGYYIHGRNILSINQKGILLLRISFGLIGLSCWYLTVIYLTLSVATVLLQTVPIFITIFAPFMTSERVGLRRFLAVIVGFIGVVILINPNLDGSFAYSGIGLFFGAGATIFGALMFITLRMLGAKDAPIPTALWYNFVGAVIFGCLAGFSNGIETFEIIIGESLWFLLIFIGISASFQQYLMAKSHQLAPVTTLAPVHYSAIPMSMFVGVLYFEEVIDTRFLLGTSIIVCATAYIFFRENIVKKNK
jgi:drug/metabolite transporter (DMT)-like permease